MLIKGVVIFLWEGAGDIGMEHSRASTTPPPPINMVHDFAIPLSKGLTIPPLHGPGMFELHSAHLGIGYDM